MEFQFSPSKNITERTEKTFIFEIPSQKILHVFNIKGIVLEPKIFF